MPDKEEALRTKLKALVEKWRNDARFWTEAPAFVELRCADALEDALEEKP